jgi:DNA-binding transcriptional regulator PaaX
MLAKDIVALDPPSSSISAILQGLEEKAGNGCEETEFVMRAMVLLVLESCKDEVRDEIGKAWVEGLRAVGTGMGVIEGPMEVVRTGVKKVGKAIMGGVRRSGEEIERVREERRRKRQDVGASEEYVTEMRIWDGMWELL